ncbi:MAG: hypothetical protein KIS92_14165 [Planctomycetota bacterium]|nr:hypothetical protein [Planctomycetota bacterium]
MSTQVVGCHNCRRLLMEWVVESGLTLNHQNRNYCRFCYSELRMAGKLDAHGDDSGLLTAVLQEITATKQDGKKQPRYVAHACPACSARFRVRMGKQKKVEGLCPKCGAYLSIEADKVKALGVRAQIVRSVSQRMGVPPESVDQMLRFFFDELSAQLAERPFLALPDLGNFRVFCNDKGVAFDASTVDITFRPSSKLLKRIVERQKTRVQNKAPRTIPPTKPRR